MVRRPRDLSVAANERRLRDNDAYLADKAAHPERYPAPRKEYVTDAEVDLIDTDGVVHSVGKYESVKVDARDGDDVLALTCSVNGDCSVSAAVRFSMQRADFDAAVASGAIEDCD